jgi:hypothetical protein
MGTSRCSQRAEDGLIIIHSLKALYFKLLCLTTRPCLMSYFLAITAVLWLVSGAALAEADDAVLNDGVAVSGLRLPEEQAARAGLRTTTIGEGSQFGEYEAVGKVVSAEPLLAARSRYTVMKAELNAARARLKLAGQNLARQEKLFHDGISAQRSLQELTALKLTEQAAAEAAQVKLTEWTNQIRLQWGETLAGWITAEMPSHLKSLVDGRRALLQITLPGNLPQEVRSASILVEPYGDRNRVRTAGFVARTVQADPAMPGEGYYYECLGDGLRAGMKLSAWLQFSIAEGGGVFLPKSALLWHAGQAFVYRKEGRDQYQRVALKSFRQNGGGYWVDDVIKAGDEVVTVGGQMLLSEELMGNQVPDDD